MNIGLFMPSLLAAERFSDRIFAPKDLFLALADGLVDRGHQVYVYSTSDTKTKAQLVCGSLIFEQKNLRSVKSRKEGSDELELRLTSLEYEADLAAIAYKHARSAGIDIMHLYMDSIGAHLAQLFPFPTAITIHDPVFPTDTIEGWRYQRFGQFPHIAISESQKRLYEDHVRVDDVVYHGVDVHTFPFTERDSGYLAFVGRIIPEKGIEDALNASSGAHIPLHIATSDNYLETEYFTHTVKPFVDASDASMAGFMKKNERDAWMKGARALLFPIKWEEPFGMVMIEAMACGTPVIAYNRGSVSEIVKDGVTGFIIEDERTQNSELNDQQGKWIIKKRGIEGIVEAIKRIREIDRAACRNDVEEHFTVEKMVEGYEKVYKKIVDGRSYVVDGN